MQQQSNESAALLLEINPQLANNKRLLSNMQAKAFTLSGFHMMGIEEQNDLRVSQCGTACDQSYTGNLLNVSSDMLDTNPENGNLEEELERIIMLADNMREKALSTEEILAGDVAIKSQKGKKDSKRSSVTSLVLRSRKSLRSGCADNSSTLLHGQPRLSPLAARAALAAAVTPLRQANQTNLSAKSQGLSLHSASCKAGTSFVKKNNRYNQVEKCQKTGVSVRRNYRNTSACKRTPEPPVKESGSFLNQCDQHIQLTVDIPVYGDQVAEKVMNLIVDVPLLGRQ
ncbi:hypothetical protein GOP47_0024600 [Adiantum capillus-veneris]|uniref:Uncharacterized protein n=1 Tax=Adiantum capillus-veneris TaxID=13818 RepID=A0A9D4U3A4_ADICA|nr:hypothetical protein GOP47_0024600 [Adiantum capillus-veneris]